MDLSKYNGDSSKSGLLSEKFHERVLLKTNLDVVYSDFTNWERGSLLFIDSDIEKGLWKKLNYIEYVWVKIVEKLRKYGFSYGEIIFYKEKLLAYIPPEELLKAAYSKKDELNLINPEVIKTITHQKNNPESLEHLNIKFSSLEFLMFNVISYNQQVSIQFDKDNPEDIGIISKAILEEFDISGNIHEYLALQNRTHLNVSLNKILSRFLLDDGQTPERQLFLSIEEHKLLKVIRNKPKSIISIAVTFKNGKMNLIKIEKTKKVELESRLMDHIQKGDYKKIEITTENGVISSFKNTKKIKL